MSNPQSGLSSPSVNSNTIQFIICFAGGICCLLPLYICPTSKMELSPLRWAILSQSNRDLSVASLSLIIPLIMDLVTELAYSSWMRGKDDNVKIRVKQSLLNGIERSATLFGTAIVPLTALFPAQTHNLAYIHACCERCQLVMIGGTVMISLCRYNSKYWTIPRTYVTLIFLAIGTITLAFTANISDTDTSRGANYVISYVAYSSILASAAIFFWCSGLWLYAVIPTISPESFGLPRTSQTEKRQNNNEFSSRESNSADHLIFPALYVIVSMTTISMLIILSALYPWVAGRDERALLMHNLSFLLYIAIVSYVSIRMMKFEVVQGLYALIESKKMYVRYISHELRTPLNSAVLGLKLLSDDLSRSFDTKDVGRCEILLDVKSACRTAVEILNDLLCFDKLESGILELHKHEVPVYSFFSDCVDMFASQAKECGVQLMVTSGEMQQKLKTNTNSTFNMITENDEFSPLNTRILKSDTVFMDRFKMDQVLRNLISNALKFTPKGGVVTVGISFIPNLDPRSSPPLEQEMVVKPSSQYSCYLTALSCQRAFRCFTGAFRGKVFSSVTCGKDEGQKGNEGGESKEFPGDESRNLKSICSLNSKTRDIERGSPSIGHSVGVSEIVIGDDKRRKSTYDSLLRSSSQSHMLNSLNTSIGIGDSLPEIILNRSNYIVAKSRGGSKSGRNSVNYPNITPNRTDSHDKDMTKFSTIDNDKSGVIHGVLRIEVVDTGAGISEANLRRLFKEVVQFNPEVLQAGGGSGLGLWITNSIVNMHAGVVRAYSAGAGKGSSFTVEIDMLRKYPLSRRDTNSNTPTGPQAALHTRMDLKSNNQSPAISLEIESRNQSFKSKLECDFPMSRTGASLKTEKPLSIGPQRLHPSSPSVPMIFPQTSESTLPVSDTVTPFTATPAFMPSPRHPGSNRLATGGNLTSGLARTMLPHIPQDLNFDSSRSLSTRVELVSPMYDVLVVDDSSLNRKMLRKIFLSSGCDCDDAYDGLCAIEKVKERMNRTEGKKSYDAILMDFVMPNMNGPTSTEEIRKLGYKGLIFGVTGNYLDSDVTYFLRKGADAVLSKPFDPIIFHKLMKEKFVNESI